MLDFYEETAKRLHRFEPYLSVVAIALFVVTITVSLQQSGDVAAYQLLQMVMLWSCGLAVISRIFNPEEREMPAGGRKVISKVRAARPWLQFIAPHLLNVWFLLLIMATVSILQN